MEQSNAPVAGTRPTFLTVLCILTWVGCAIAIVGNAIAYMAVGAVSALKDATVDGFKNMADSLGTTVTGADADNMNSANDAANAAIANGATVALIGIVAALLCLVGSVMMWQLKKMGFYIYTVANLGAVIATAVLLGGGAFGGAMAVMGMIFPVAFVVMYGLNLKHMK